MTSPQMKFYLNNRDKIIEYKRTYRNKNRERLRLVEKLRQRERRRDCPEIYLLAAAKRRAKINKLPFNLDISDIRIPRYCPILGIELKPNFGGGTSSNCSPSLDRIIPELGYVKGNVSVISYRANRLKSDLSFENIEKLYEYVKGKNGQPDS